MNDNYDETITESKKTSGSNKHLNIIIIVLSVLCVLMLGKILLFENILVQHTSMFPTIAHGDTVTLLKSHNIDRFDIIVFDDVEDSQKKLIKRVIGIGGDTLEIDENGILHISYYDNGNLVEEIFTEDYINSSNIELPPVTVPSGMIYVLGDNRLVSRDSSEFGAIPDSIVLGKIIGLE